MEREIINLDWSYQSRGDVELAVVGRIQRNLPNSRYSRVPCSAMDEKADGVWSNGTIVLPICLCTTIIVNTILNLNFIMQSIKCYISKKERCAATTGLSGIYADSCTSAKKKFICKGTPVGKG